RERRRARVAAMLGAEGDDAAGTTGPEFPPALDVIAPVIGFAGLFAAAAADGGPYAQTLARLVVGAAFVGVVSDAMLLGHWYLVQPGLSRDPIKELVRWSAWLWPFELLVWLWPTGMISVLDGTIDDGWGGLLGWAWALSAFTTALL